MDRITEILLADGNSSELNWSGGVGFYFAQGDFGGGEVNLEYSLDNGISYLDVGVEGKITENGGKKFSLPVCKVRMKLLGSTAPNLKIFIA